jgi:NitT/TauT family transport system substrate-binding protein
MDKQSQATEGSMRLRAPVARVAGRLILALVSASLLAAASCSGPASPTPRAPTAGPGAAPTERSAAAGDPVDDPDTRNSTLTRIAVAYSSYSSPFLPMFVAREAGLWEKYGLDVDLIYISTGPTVTQGMVAGEIAFAGVGAAVIDARLMGSDLVVIADMVPVLLFSLYGDPAIGSVGELRGKTIAASQRGGAADLAGRLTLRRFGLVPDDDVSFLYAGGMPSILAAAQQRIVSAGVISAPSTLQARDLGLREIVDIGALRIPFPHDLIAASAPYARQNPDVVRRFLKGYIEAIKRLRDDKPLAMQALGKWTRTDDPRLQEEAYDNVVDVFARLPLMSPEPMQAALDESLSPNAKDARPGDLYDNSYVEALRGWTEQLYR